MNIINIYPSIGLFTNNINNIKGVQILNIIKNNNLKQFINKKKNTYLIIDLLFDTILFYKYLIFFLQDISYHDKTYFILKKWLYDFFIFPESLDDDFYISLFLNSGLEAYNEIKENCELINNFMEKVYYYDIKKNDDNYYNIDELFLKNNDIFSLEDLIEEIFNLCKKKFINPLLDYLQKKTDPNIISLIKILKERCMRWRPEYGHKGKFRGPYFSRNEKKMKIIYLNNTNKKKLFDYFFNHKEIIFFNEFLIDKLYIIKNKIIFKKNTEFKNPSYKVKNKTIILTNKKNEINLKLNKLFEEDIELENLDKSLDVNSKILIKNGKYKDYTFKNNFINLFDDTIENIIIPINKIIKNKHLIFKLLIKLANNWINVKLNKPWLNNENIKNIKKNYIYDLVKGLDDFTKCGEHEIKDKNNKNPFILEKIPINIDCNDFLEVLLEENYGPNSKRFFRNKHFFKIFNWKEYFNSLEYSNLYIIMILLNKLKFKIKSKYIKKINKYINYYEDFNSWNKHQNIDKELYKNKNLGLFLDLSIKLINRDIIYLNDNIDNIVDLYNEYYKTKYNYNELKQIDYNDESYDIKKQNNKNRIKRIKIINFILKILEDKDLKTIEYEISTQFKNRVYYKYNYDKPKIRSIKDLVFYLNSYNNKKIKYKNNKDLVNIFDDFHIFQTKGIIQNYLLNPTKKNGKYLVAYLNLSHKFEKSINNINY